MSKGNNILERLNNICEAYGNDVICYVIVRKKGKHRKEIIASKLLKDFSEDLEDGYIQ